ncbi:carbohydrate kinase family protein [Mycobacterium yunnanensis]|uniref:Carbohydrate kinase family protein n=1 Tax=Mycobacterium yunnanensis TaxID=368477 RepID=A0A9X2YQP7_9MYCO|nr:carbohydrate kinase family protein [Mycobacterium yunnanensis]MCV7423867.1 carbohydrate kinase family protein [Mycobacterium yunnanensis]
MSESPTLVCVGNLTVDETVSPAGERVESVGGDALFAALAARVAGGRPLLLAPLGTDAPPALLAAIRSTGTDPRSLPARDIPLIRNVIHYDETGGRVWDLVRGEEHFEALSVVPSDVPPQALTANGVLLSAMALRPQLDVAAWLRPRTAATIFFDPQEDYVIGHEAALGDAVAACDVFLPSEIEAAALAGTSDLDAAAAIFLELGPRVVVIKRAEAGCLVATREHPEPVVVPAETVTPVDSTGAGDAFCGAFAVEYLRSGDAVGAARVAAAIARLAVSGPGVSALLAAVDAYGGVPG